MHTYNHIYLDASLQPHFFGHPTASNLKTPGHKHLRVNVTSEQDEVISSVSPVPMPIYNNNNNNNNMLQEQGQEDRGGVGGEVLVGLVDTNTNINTNINSGESSSSLGRDRCESGSRYVYSKSEFDFRMNLTLYCWYLISC